MADKKISQLTSATTPLAGTEVLPIVQSGSTVKVAVSDLTAGRAVSAAGVTDTTLTASKGVFTDASKKLTSTGTLGVDQGGTGTGTALTAGSVVFAGASGVYSESNANFFWDNANSRLGIGTASPATKVEVVSASTTQFRLRMSGQADMRMVSDTGIGVVGTYSNHQLAIRTNNADVFVLSTGRDATISAGNIIQGTAAKGFDFSANTGAAGKTSSLLNWYEEGTWTPVVEGTTTAGTATYSTRNAIYTRIGRVVHAEVYMIWTGGTGTGNMRISGLPFNPSSASTYTPALVRQSDVVVPAGETIYARAEPSTNYLRFYSVTTAGTATELAYDADAFIILSVTYTV